MIQINYRGLSDKGKKELSCSYSGPLGIDIPTEGITPIHWIAEVRVCATSEATKQRKLTEVKTTGSGASACAHFLQGLDNSLFLI